MCTCQTGSIVSKLADASMCSGSFSFGILNFMLCLDPRLQKACYQLVIHLACLGRQEEGDITLLATGEQGVCMLNTLVVNVQHLIISILA